MLLSRFPPDVMNDITWKQFESGKISSKTFKYSRFYLRFRNKESLLQFHKALHGTELQDSGGNSYYASVEFAPFQEVPSEKIGLRKERERDTRENTYEKLPLWEEFLRHDDSAKEKNREKPPAAIGTASAAQKTSTVVVSPLLAHLREIDHEKYNKKKARKTVEGRKGTDEKGKGRSEKGKRGKEKGSRTKKKEKEKSIEEVKPKEKKPIPLTEAPWAKQAAAASRPTSARVASSFDSSKGSQEKRSEAEAKNQQRSVSAKETKGANKGAGRPSSTSRETGKSSTRKGDAGEKESAKSKGDYVEQSTRPESTGQRKTATPDRMEKQTKAGDDSLEQDKKRNRDRPDRAIYRPGSRGRGRGGKGQQGKRE